MKKLSTILLLGALLLAGFAGNALAWVSAACTPINNRAELTFSVGGVVQPVLESSPLGNSTLGAGNGADTSFTVDSRVDLNVAVLASPVSATGTNQIMRFQITNLGNDTQQYQLQLFAGTNGADDDFNMTNVRVYLDNNDDGLVDGGDTLVATDVGGAGPAFGANLGLTGDVLGDLGGNNTIDIIVVSDVPAGQTSTTTAAYALKAISYQSVATGGAISVTGPVGAGGVEANNSCGNPVVIGDDDTPASALVSTVSDAARDGADYAAGEYTVVAAGVSVTKAVSAPLWDPFNLAVTPQAIPGAYVQYAITVSNAAASAPATLTQITDILAGQLAMDPDLATAGPTTFEDALGNGFKVEHTTGRGSLASPSYYTTSDADAGVGHDGSATGGTITAIFADLLPNVDGYAAGELRAGESVTITFNVIIQ